MVTLPQGTQLQDYDIIRVLGAGGFGITYLAEDRSLRKKFAIKEYFPQSWANRDATDSVSLTANTGAQSDYQWGLDRFLEEARTLAKFRHPAIVDVNAIIEANNTAYMILDYEEGMDLRDWLDQLGRQPTQAELDGILGPLLDALSLIHRNGILHRDIAPDNIYIRTEGTPVLLDFGAAREAFGQRTQTLSAIVKSGYSPQEQYSTAGRDQGPWTDIYALGATLYRAVTGEAPPESVQRSLDDQYVPARAKAKGQYRPEFLAAIDHALQLHPAARPQSIADWRQQLLGDGEMPQTRKREVPLGFSPPRGGPPPPDRGSRLAGDAPYDRRDAGGSPLKWVALASLIGALVAGGAYYAIVKRPDSTTQLVNQDTPGQPNRDQQRDRDQTTIDRSRQDDELARRERTAWDEARSQNNRVAYQDYLNQFPEGQFSKDARDRLAALEPQQQTPQQDTNLQTGDGRDRETPTANLSPACLTGLQNWRNKASHGAFAAEKQGGCGWSWGYATEEEARQAALRECAKQGPSCSVIEVHRSNKGDYTLSDSCQRNLQDWKKRPGRSAFAAERRGGCGWSYGFQTIAEARDRALAECRKQGPECRLLDSK